MEKNILVFPCGTEIGLEINNALKFVKFINLYGGSSTEDSGRMVYKNYIPSIPYVTEENFIDKINEIIKQYNINYIFPAHDSVVLFLAQHQNDINAEIITSESTTCEICRSKLKTYELFKKEKFTPKVYNCLEDVKKYPVFVKPDVGQGSKGARLINSREELEIVISNLNEKMAIVEYLPGKEYTVDCFSDSKGELIYCAMRERIRTRNGISVNCKTMNLDEKVKSIANIINQNLKFRGMWFFQVKLDSSNNYKLLEIAPRIAGTMCLHRNVGINFELMSIYDRMGYEINTIHNSINLEVERALINRFNLNYEYNTVYVDFDDTIINKGKVNEVIILFLYQCLNRNRKIILITKHIKDIKETLKKFQICEEVFSEIILLRENEKKSKYINMKENAIFIDDSFKEREDVSTKVGIPCFDLDELEALIDWKK